MGKEKKRKKEKKHRSHSKERRKKHKHKEKSKKRDRSPDLELEELLQLKAELKQYTSIADNAGPPPAKVAKRDASPQFRQSRRPKSPVQEDGFSSFDEAAQEELSPPPPRRRSEAASGGDISLSVDETNRIRAKLGLKPLDTGASKPTPSSQRESEIPGIGDWNVSDQPTLIPATDGGQPFVHKPAANLTQAKKTEKLREKLEQRKEKRRLEKKMKSVRGLGDSGSDDEDASQWVKKMKQMQEEKKKAEQRAKLLEEMDNEFGVGDLVEDEFAKDRSRAYSSKDLKGIVVEHNLELFKEDREVILTLKDQNILDENTSNILQNVSMAEAERTAKNIENRKKKAAYKPYDMEDVDDFGMVTKKNLLSKYDEELTGEKKDTFVLGTDSELAKKKETIKQKLAAQKGLVSLTVPSLQLATEYYTSEEMTVKFKKPRKKPRKVRKKEKMLKADDLIGLEHPPVQGRDFSSRTVDEEEVYLYGEKSTKPEEDDELGGPDDDLSNVVVDPDEALLELQHVLNKTRKLKQKSVSAHVSKLAENIIPEEPMEITSSKEQLSDNPNKMAITLNETAEFCRSLGDIPTYGQAGNRDEDAEELMDLERELQEERARQEEESMRKSDWKEVDAEDGAVNVKFIEEGVPILEEEPDVRVGMMASVQMATKKGYLETNTKKVAVSKVSQLRAHNYSIEDKSFDDDKHRSRGDRYNGPLVEFSEKSHYNPAVKLEYIDDSGRILNSKEAFRYLSHKFHGKGSGKNKTEKRMKKLQEIARVKEMSSTDTPLRTLDKLQEKQKLSNTPFLVLSGQNKQIGLQPISKGK